MQGNGASNGCATMRPRPKARFQVIAFAALVTGGICGCDNRPAPSPILNPNSQITKNLRITVEKSEVNRVEVDAIWSVGNLGCAPISLPAGNERVKQVVTSEEVDKEGDSYIAKIAMDRFLPDPCRWNTGVVQVKFYRDGYLVSRTGVNGDVLSGERVDRLTCLTMPIDVAYCGQKASIEKFYKSEDKNAFNATVELVK
ncbi:hypothetical protein [Pinirhizobacter soli]|uniref:hypothetical protein n=1 Tax=Pinirhizobacter soli TaxID=2786953 RepID=UPI00202A71DB|nr:hypothetical protein [Pinirhizobacter soli]